MRDDIGAASAAIVSRNIAAVVASIGDNNDRLEAITHVTTEIGDFSAITLDAANEGYHAATDDDIINQSGGDYGLPSFSFSAAETTQVGISVPAGTNVAFARMVLVRGGAKTYYPSAETSTRLIQYEPSMYGVYIAEDFYYLANSGDTDAADIAFMSGDQFYMEVAARDHTYEVTLDSVPVTIWQDTKASPAAAPDSGVTEGTAYVQGGLLPVHFEAQRGRRHLHFELSADYVVDLITIGGEDIITEFTVSESGGVRRYDSARISSRDALDMFLRVLRSDQ